MRRLPYLRVKQSKIRLRFDVSFKRHILRVYVELNARILVNYYFINGNIDGEFRELNSTFELNAGSFLSCFAKK